MTKKGQLSSLDETSLLSLDGRGLSLPLRKQGVRVRNGNRRSDDRECRGRFANPNDGDPPLLPSNLLEHLLVVRV